MTESIKSFEDVEKAIDKRRRLFTKKSLKVPDYDSIALNELDFALDILRELKASELFREKFNQKPAEIILKGNELGWLIKLAETHFDSSTFHEWLKKANAPKLFDMSQNLLNKFYPCRFNAGGSETTWELRRLLEGEK
jgi:hypothetical protein